MRHFKLLKGCLGCEEFNMGYDKLIAKVMMHLLRVKQLNWFLKLYIKQLTTGSRLMYIFTTVTKEHCTTKLLPNKSLDLSTQCSGYEN
jgi:hypothetical protein